MQNYPGEYAQQMMSRHAEHDVRGMSDPVRQRRWLAGLSFGLWSLVCGFVLWNNTGDAHTFSGTAYTFLASNEHFLLVAGLIVLTGLLFFINLVFKPRELSRPESVFAYGQDREKLRVPDRRWSRFARRVRGWHPLAVTLGSLAIWLVTFVGVVWQSSDNAFSLLHYMLYNNQSFFATMQNQVIYGLLYVFFLVSALVFLANFWFYRRKQA